VRPRSALGPWVRLPRTWTASVRGRRLLLVATLAPGVLIAVFGAEVRQSPLLLGLGLAWILIVGIARWLGEPRVPAREFATAPLEPLPASVERSQ
jgi:hypothetical protein